MRKKQIIIGIIIAIIVLLVVIIYAINIPKSTIDNNINTTISTNKNIDTKDIETSSSGNKETTITGKNVNDEINKILNGNKPNLKIKVDWKSAPLQIDTYYFYDKAIVKTTEIMGEVIINGEINDETRTVYYFDKNIDLTEINNFLSLLTPTDSEFDANITITKNDGSEYLAKDIEKSNSKPHSELEKIIKSITDSATENKGAQIELKTYDD